jgi:hypothetical protein
MWLNVVGYGGVGGGGSDGRGVVDCVGGGGGGGGPGEGCCCALSDALSPGQRVSWAVEGLKCVASRAVESRSRSHDL